MMLATGSSRVAAKRTAAKSKHKERNETPIVLRRSNPNATCSVLSVFNEMRQNTELCDVKIVVNDRYLSAHRSILAATFPFFRAKFQSGTQEHQKEIVINDVEANALESLINFAYGKELKITVENVQTLLFASDFLGIEEVKRECGVFMARNLDIENVLQVRNIAERLCSMKLIESCDQCLLENLEELFESERFLNLSFSVFGAILKGMAFYRIFYSNSIQEETLFEAVISWIKALKVTDGQRERMLSELFSHIQLERISLDYLCERVACEELIRKSPLCTKLVDKAKATYMLSNMTSVFSTLFYSSSKRVLLGSDSTKFFNQNSLYAVCSSENFGLYVRIYDSVKTKWVTLSPGIFMKSGFQHVTCDQFSIDVFGLKMCTRFCLDRLRWCTREEPQPVFRKVLKHDNKMYVFDSDPCSSNESVRWSEDARGFGEDTVESKSGKKLMKIIMPSFACFKGWIYVSGGQFEGKCLNEFEKYCLESDTWTKLPPMRQERCGHISAVLEDDIYVCGGMNDLQQNLDTVDVFHTRSNWWSSVLSMKVPRSRFSLCSWKGKLYATGGHEKSGLAYSFEIFDPKIGDWQHGAPIHVWDEVGKTKVKITSYSY